MTVHCYRSPSSSTSTGQVRIAFGTYAGLTYTVVCPRTLPYFSDHLAFMTSSTTRRVAVPLAALIFAVASCDNGHGPVRPDENVAPALPKELTLGVVEDSSVVIDVFSHATDENGDSLRYGPFGPAKHGRVDLTASGLRYTPEPNYFGSDAVPVAVHDGVGGTAETLLAVSVEPVNDPPAAADDAVHLREDEAVDVDVLSNDSDIDGESLSVRVVRPPSHGSAAIRGSLVRYASDPDYHGPDTLSYEAVDAAGASDTAYVLLTVAPVNDPPRTRPDSAGVLEDESVRIDVLANDTDAEGDSLKVESFGQAAHGTVARDLEQVTYIPDPDFNGTDSFEYVATDTAGATSTEKVFVDVAEVADPPSAKTDTFQVVEDSVAHLDVLANDFDVDGDTLSLVGLGTAGHGTAILESGRVRYRPEADFGGTDSFTYVVADPDGNQAEGFVHIVISSVNDRPVARNDSLTTDEDQPVVLDLLANDSDPDGDLLALHGYDEPGLGTVVQAQVLPRDHRVHPPHRFRVARVDGEDPRVRVGRAQDLPVQHPRQGEVVGVRRAAGGLGGGIDAGQALADEGELAGDRRVELLIRPGGEGLAGAEVFWAHGGFGCAGRGSRLWSNDGRSSRVASNQSIPGGSLPLARVYLHLPSMGSAQWGSAVPS